MIFISKLNVFGWGTVTKKRKIQLLVLICLKYQFYKIVYKERI